MKNKPAGLALALAFAFILHPSSFCLSQGLLTPPPGAPAPTMKTLDQVEARTPISSAPFPINASGSYYLTGNLSVATGDGITITTDHVTLDLNGFTISSTASPATGNGVLVNGTRTNITIKNGHIRGTTTFSGGAFTGGGFQNGVISTTATSTNIRVTEVQASGLGNNGIQLVFNNTASVVAERCAASVCARVGISAGVVRDCVVKTVGGFGIVADLAVNSSSDAVGTDLADDDAITATVVENCRGTAVAGVGIVAHTVSNSHGTSVSGNGLSATIATNCTGISTSSVGLSASNAHHCLGTSVSGGFGLSANGTASFCRGSRNGGVALNANVAIGCSVLGTGTVTSANKFLGTP